MHNKVNKVPNVKVLFSLLQISFKWESQAAASAGAAAFLHVDSGAAARGLLFRWVDIQVTTIYSVLHLIKVHFSVQCSAVQCSEVQCSAVQCSAFLSVARCPYSISWSVARLTAVPPL
jgi:hypothetical protein